ncbi:NAD-dependent epimerase/dehydratase family protein [Clostridium sp. MSJ-8]|uniref:NAD-dependent epimerase/dehydratase family protein n=1 Tax=Clostridium sp. MSJ-8 TaxID=2841510 RepID=UPI001C0F1D04|nr:NAD-dependent epimerase/dehydratase family protein [Clostridium sp. MSJ-8]MBU5488430.1 NAD-dependent epimerase/dehydratase family protein [Clostridium sp. MSJ-8]
MNKILDSDLQYTYKRLSEEEVNRLKQSIIIITGCAGFLGYYFTHFLYKFRNELELKKVICLDNFMLGYPKWIDKFKSDERFVIEKFDIIKDKISDIDGAEDADYIIHMASIASPMFYRKYPIETLDANIWGLRSLLDYYAEKDIKGFLFYSSSELYGDPVPEAIPTSEEYFGNVCATGPRSCYDESKRFGETMCMLFAQRYNMPIGVARPFNNYGPGMKLNDKRVPADFAKDIVEGKDIVILSSGSPTRTFCYIADAIAGYFKILLHGKYDYFNIGIEEPEISISELAEIYKEAGQEIFGYKGNVIYNTSEDKEYLTNNPERRCPNIQKARKILDYEPTILVKEGVYRFLQFIKESDEGDLIW